MENIYNLKRAVLSLKDLSCKVRMDSKFNYEFCSLSNSVRNYVLEMHDYPQLQNLISKYPIIEVRKFENKFFQIPEYIYNNLPFYLFQPLSDLVQINIYPDKKAYNIYVIKQSNIITGICDELLTEIDYIVDNH